MRACVSPVRDCVRFMRAVACRGENFPHAHAHLLLGGGEQKVRGDLMLVNLCASACAENLMRLRAHTRETATASGSTVCLCAGEPVSRACVCGCLAVCALCFTKPHYVRIAATYLHAIRVSVSNYGPSSLSLAGWLVVAVVADI